MGGKNGRRKCECVLEYTKMKSDEMPCEHLQGD